MAEQVPKPRSPLIAMANRNGEIQFKAEGTKAFSAKNFPLAIELYTKVHPCPLILFGSQC